MAFNKEKALFWLNRRVRELESTAPQHEAMAEQGLSYAARQEVVSAHEIASKQRRDEIDTLRDVVFFIEERS